MLEGLGDLSRQNRRFHRFEEVLEDVGGVHGLHEVLRIAVSGNDQRHEVVCFLADFLDQSDTCHPRHPHVGEDEIEGVLAAVGKGLFRIAKRKGFVVLQNALTKRQVDLVVVDEHNFH